MQWARCRGGRGAKGEPAEQLQTAGFGEAAAGSAAGLRPTQPDRCWGRRRLLRLERKRGIKGRHGDTVVTALLELPGHREERGRQEADSSGPLPPRPGRRGT